MSHLVRLSRRGRLAVLTLDRPPANAIDLELVRQADAALARIEAAADLDALVVTGSGSSFCAGLDLKLVPAYTRDQQREMILGVNGMITRLYGLPLPTVAAVNGHAVAGGLCLALACDYRVGPVGDAKLGLTEARAGIPFPAGPRAVVASQLSPDVVRRITLEARNFGPELALARGILDELCPPGDVLARALEVAGSLAQAPRHAYAAVKEQFRAPALREMREAVAAGRDPLLDAWLSPETAQAAASVLRRDRTEPHP